MREQRASLPEVAAPPGDGGQVTKVASYTWGRLDHAERLVYRELNGRLLATRTDTDWTGVAASDPASWPGWVTRTSYRMDGLVASVIPPHLAGPQFGRAYYPQYARGALVNVGDNEPLNTFLAGDIRYGATGQVNEIRFRNGARTVTTRDALQRPRTIGAWSGSVPLWSSGTYAFL